MYQKISFHIRGVVPILLHNGQLSDPLNPFVQAIRVITSKRNKTDADHLEIDRLCFLASLYLDEKNNVVIPGVNIEAMIIENSPVKRRNNFKSGVVVEGHWPLVYKGPKGNPEALWNDKRFMDRRRVIVDRKAIWRVRPRFDEWELCFDVNYNDELLNARDVNDSVSTAGRNQGLGDYTPRFGRFNVIKAS